MKYILILLQISILLALDINKVEASQEPEEGGPHRCTGFGFEHVMLEDNTFSRSNLPSVGEVITRIISDDITLNCEEFNGYLGLGGGKEYGIFRAFFTTKNYPVSTIDTNVCKTHVEGIGIRKFMPNGTPIPCGTFPTPRGYRYYPYTIAVIYGYELSKTISFNNGVVGELVRIGDIQAGNYTFGNIQNIATWGDWGKNLGDSWGKGGNWGFSQRIDDNILTISDNLCTLRPLNEEFNLGSLAKEKEAAIQPIKIYLDGCNTRADVEEFKSRSTLSFLAADTSVDMFGRINNCDREECAQSVYISLRDWHDNYILAGAGRKYELSTQDIANPALPHELQFNAHIDTEAATAGIIDTRITVLLETK